MTIALIILAVILLVSRIKVQQPAVKYPKTPSQQYAEQVAISRATRSCYDWSDVKQRRG